MVYIVSDERIAVENFEQGKIYKVDFVDESVLYGVCVGIGSDFVMLSGDISGYIFPLTMQTASQVTSIDLYDPTPPEPPVPWTNLLQYQTGVPPFEFPTTDTSLFSWFIEGEGVGDKTANLLDYTQSESGGIDASGNYVVAANLWRSTVYIEIDATLQYFISWIKAYTTFQAARINYYTDNKTHISREQITNSGTVLTIPQNAKYIKWTLYTSAGTVVDLEYVSALKLMLNSGEAALDYEPFGYKIPILCNDNLTNIYLDAPLSEGEILYSTDIDTAIVTDIGDNELSVETTQQPTAMQIVYKIADR